VVEFGTQLVDMIAPNQTSNGHGQANEQAKTGENIGRADHTWHR
jgi:hypothetical protein